MDKYIRPATLAVAMAITGSAWAGSTYRFTVTCPQGGSLVKVWKTGDIDPGQEYLRFATGGKHPNCSISDFNPGQDAHLRQETVSHEAAVIEALPPVVILRRIFGI